MRPETKAKYEDFTIRWGQYIPSDQRTSFIIETSQLMCDFGKDCFDEFVESMRRKSEVAGKSELTSAPGPGGQV
jgi:hypothetical protein